MNVIDVALELAVCVLVTGILAILYPVMVLPLLDGAVHVTVAVVLPEETLAVPIPGALGTV